MTSAIRKAVETNMSKAVDDIKALFELAGCYEDYERITSLEEFAWNKGNPIQFGRRNIVYYDYVNDNIEVSSQCTDRFRQTAELLGFEIIGTESKEIRMESRITRTRSE